MPFDRGRGLTKLWVAAGWPAHRRLHPESITTARRRGRLVAGVADWPLERSLLPIFSSLAITCLRPDQDRGGAQRGPPARLTSARARSATTGRVSGPPQPTTFGEGWFIAGESRDASGRNKRIGPRPGSAAGYLSRPLAPDWAAFPLGGFSAPFCLANGLSATDDVFPIQQQFFFLVSRSNAG